MRLLYFVLPAAVGLLAGCAERMPATEARVALHVGHVATARRVVEGRGHVSEGPKGHASAAPRGSASAALNGHAAEAPNIDLNKICHAVEQSDEPTQDRHRWCLESEQGAKNELQQRWHALSAADRSTCTPSSTGGVEPSYVELLTCFEIISAVKTGPSEYRTGAQWWRRHSLDLP
jgi:hypothetical protein